MWLLSDASFVWEPGLWGSLLCTYIGFTCTHTHTQFFFFLRYPFKLGDCNFAVGALVSWRLLSKKAADCYRALYLICSAPLLLRYHSYHNITIDKGCILLEYAIRVWPGVGISCVKDRKTEFLCWLHEQRGLVFFF